MTIAEALHRLEARYRNEQTVRQSDDIKLGIGALKEIKRARANGYTFVAVRLPGETDPLARHHDAIHRLPA